MAARESETVLLHNPRCSKSRAAKALLEERGVAFAERLYLEEPLSADELRALGAKLGKAPAEWLRARESEYAAAGLGPGSTDDELYAAMAAHPILMERPILVRGARARVGRPPEDVLDLL